MTLVPTFGSAGIAEPGVVYKERRAAYAVIVDDVGRVGAVRGRDRYFLPGGGALPDEDAEGTILREVREELARDARLVNKIGEAVQYFYSASDDCHYRMEAVFFLAELTGLTGLVDMADKPRLLAQGEHELCWLHLAEAEQAFYHESHVWAARLVLQGVQGVQSVEALNLQRRVQGLESRRGAHDERVLETIRVRGSIMKWAIQSRRLYAT